ncbi:MAG: molybdate ABC transporter substrate-binding protein [Gammaproteobacteria bacterium]|nr:molybdate ABC transporter substrate-binding protein [Gammaproteobacteria bacterium]MBU1653907.1 molybdate ABC transporter substrate-binding protein [Gammaproteobacteria bacterium]MBU1962342.1 molybdate ABC transporter substrate-binding protein [Gammaproteobacteria bacterium]
MMRALCGCALVLLLGMGNAAAEEIRVAVASNFAEAIKAIAGRFESKTHHRVTLVFGASGKHYAQIRNGAPFEAFFSADAETPALLEREGRTQPGSRFTYAIGRLVLWSPQAGLVDADGRVLKEGGFRYLAIANPKLAPYGKAAEQLLVKLGHWEGLQGRLVRGENIGQTFQFVKSGNAELGFVAYAQIRTPHNPVEGSFWEVPQSLYDPIEQQAVLLRNSEAARAFLAFMKGGEALEIMRGFGYGIP